MDVLENKQKKNDYTVLNKSGNIRELLKAGKASNINLDISRLSGKGFSNLLEKAKKLQDLKKKEENQYEKYKTYFTFLPESKIKVISLHQIMLKR